MQRIFDLHAVGAVMSRLRWFRPTQDYDPVVGNHPNGDRINIVGGCQMKTPMARVPLHLVLNEWFWCGVEALNSLSGFKLIGQDQAPKALVMVTIPQVLVAKEVSMADNLDVSGFGWGVLATANESTSSNQCLFSACGTIVVCGMQVGNMQHNIIRLMVFM